MVLLLFFLILTGVMNGQSIDDEKAAITAMLFQQMEGWNNGDLEAYMQGYWQSDSLVFVGGKYVTYGWENILERYKRGYPSKDKMGILDFEIVSLEILPGGYAFMIGGYSVKTADGEATGAFTLLWKKFDNKWLVVADHSS